MFSDLALQLLVSTARLTSKHHCDDVQPDGSAADPGAWKESLTQIHVWPQVFALA